MSLPQIEHFFFNFKFTIHKYVSRGRTSLNNTKLILFFRCSRSFYCLRSFLLDFLFNVTIAVLLREKKGLKRSPRAPQTRFACITNPRASMVTFKNVPLPLIVPRDKPILRFGRTPNVVPPTFVTKRPDNRPLPLLLLAFQLTFLPR